MPRNCRAKYVCINLVTIQDCRLINSDKLLIGYIDYLSKENNGCWETDTRLGEIVGMSAKSVGNRLTYLSSINLVSRTKSGNIRSIKVQKSTWRSEFLKINFELLTCNSLNNSSKLLLAIIESFSLKCELGCYATNSYLGIQLGCSEGNIKNMLTSFVKLNLITINQSNTRYIKLVNKSI